MRGNVFVDERRPFLIIDAVDDADEVSGTVAQHMVDAEAVLRRLDFVGVGRRNRRDFRRVVKRALHHVQPAEALVVVRREKPPRQAEIIDDVLGAKTLVLQVVNREDRSCAGDAPPVVPRVEHRGNEPRRPVVAVNDVGNPIRLLAEIDRRAAEEGEAVGVVAALGINLGSAEKVVVFAEANLRLVERHRPDAAIRVHAETELRADGIGIRRPFADSFHGAVKRREHADVVPAFRDGFRQRGDRVAEPAGFGIRRDFRGNHQDFHGR